MRKILILVLVIFVVVSPASAKDWTDFLKERTTVFFIEGQAVGDMVIGARAKITASLLDYKMIEETQKAWGDVPDDLKDLLQYVTDDRFHGAKIFGIRVDTYQMFDFAPEMLSIDGYAITASDICTRQEYTPRGLLASGQTYYFAVSVPKKQAKSLNLSKGIEISIGDYGSVIGGKKK